MILPAINIPPSADVLPANNLTTRRHSCNAARLAYRANFPNLPEVVVVGHSAVARSCGALRSSDWRGQAGTYRCEPALPHRKSIFVRVLQQVLTLPTSTNSLLPLRTSITRVPRHGARRHTAFARVSTWRCAMSYTLSDRSRSRSLATNVKVRAIWSVITPLC